MGEQLLTFDEIGWLKDIGIASISHEYSCDYSNAEISVLPYLITFSDSLGNGNMFCFHRDTKEIFYFDHDKKPYLTKHFDKVDDYLKGCLIMCQSDFFGEGIDQDEVDGWTKEIIEELYGKDVLSKWIYL
jgi:hypothetical protein